MAAWIEVSPLTNPIQTRSTRVHVLCIIQLAVTSEDKPKKKEVTADSLLHAIEEAYPNSLTVDDMARWDPSFSKKV